MILESEIRSLVEGKMHQIGGFLVDVKVSHTNDITVLIDLDDGITDGGEMAIDRGYGLQISGAADCNTLTEIPVYIHVKGAGSTYELLQIDDRTDGAPII